MIPNRREFLSWLGGAVAVMGSAAVVHSGERLNQALIGPLAQRHSDHTVPVTPPVTPKAVWAELHAGNQRFMAGTPQVREFVHLRASLVAGQHPKAIVLSCADSRVAPELVFDQNLGDLFVVRTAGNVADAIALGSIEYAVEHLHVPLIVVLGHEKCGAVAAVAAGHLPEPNLDDIEKKIAPALLSLRATASGEKLVRLGVEANARQSAKDLRSNSPLLHAEVTAEKVQILTAVYHLESGEVSLLS